MELPLHTFRGVQVILDADLARLYEVKTEVLNQVRKRNAERFPDEFAFQLTSEEWRVLRSQIVISNSGTRESQEGGAEREIVAASRGGRRYAPWVFTEHGVTMLAALLSSPRAVEVSILIVREFVRMRRELISYSALAHRLDAFESRVGAGFSEIWEFLREMLESPALVPKLEKIGFRQPDDPLRSEAA